MTNPLLTDAPLPAFGAIEASHVEPAIRQLLDANRREIAALLASGADQWDTLIVPIERMHHRLARAWSPVGHLNGVMNSDDLRAAYNACLPLLTAYHTELGQNAELCAAYQRVADREGAALSAEQRKLVENALRDFRLAGVSLPDDRKQRFGEVMERLATAQSKFDENVLDATNAWSRHVVDERELDGLPANAVHRARAAAEAAGSAGWLFSLDAPTYQAVLTHAANEPLRRDFYEAWVTRASDRGPHAGQWDNGPLMAEILALRHEAANLVGFANFAEYSLATKMARDPAEVVDFLQSLARVSRPAAEREFTELEQFAGRPLPSWDVAFYSEKLKNERLQVSEEALRPYFPLPRVLAGLFTVVTRLYGVRIVANPSVEVYHPDVRFFDVLERDGTPRGGFFLDLYARPKKRGGAWMDECVGRIRTAEASALPVAYLVCNFSPAAGEQPSLLTHHEVLTLFHEFGHGLHHMLTRVDYPSVAGINGVPWDAVELPSQFMENFAWRDEVLPLISAHVETGEPLPHEMLARAAGQPHVPGRHADRAAARIRAVRFPAARGIRAGPAAAHRRDPGRGARGGRRRAAAGVQPLPAQLPARVLGRLRGRVLQLQVGRGAVRRRVRRVRGTAAYSTSRRRAASCARSSSAAAAATRWRPSSSSAAASPRSSRCCGRWASRRRPRHAHRHLERQFAARPPAAPDGLARGQPGGRRSCCRRRSCPTPTSRARRSRRSATRSRSAVSAPTTASRSCRAQPLDDVVAGIPGFEDEQKRVLAATVAGVRVIDVYVPNGQTVGSEKYEYKLRWFAALREYVAAELARHPHLVVLGDYNVAPEDRDVHDPKAWEGSVHVSEPERAALRALLATGLEDCFRRFEQPEKSYSWWDYRMMAFRRNAGLRIDLILASTALAQNCGGVSHRQGATQARTAVGPRAGGRGV